MPSRSPAQRRAIANRQAAVQRRSEAAFLGSVNISAAQREQGEVTTLDLALVGIARQRHPRAVWWWGERVIEGTNGAYCYLCDRLVASWHRAYPTPRAAVESILDHRRVIHGADPFTKGSQTGATSAPADQ